jgi:predicted DNA-binding transcriptional regulator YafY
MHIKSFDDYIRIFEDEQQILTKLEDAINNKFVCIIDYRGETLGKIDNGIRYIEPYVIGTNTRGNTVLRAWMIKGVSRTGKIDPSLVPGWRLYRLDRIFNVDPTLDTFIDPKKGYNAKDSKMSDIIISAKF